MNKKLKKLITSSAFLIGGMHIANEYINACITPVLPKKEEKTFTWKDMKIVYCEKGNELSQPLLLVHNLFPSSSKEEWYRIDETLAKKYHIFELDLPGCGKSDKPDITYVNYMYVQILTDFIKQIISQKTNICATGYSSSFTFMIARMNPELINKIIIINPTSIDELIKATTKQNKIKKYILDLPIIGTFLYNCMMSKSSIIDDYKYIYFYNDRNVPQKAINISYYNAHYKNSEGRYLLSSILGNYTNINIIHALPKLEQDIYLIGNGNTKNIQLGYKKYNQNIKIIYVSNCRLIPQLEIPETISEKISSILK